MADFLGMFCLVWGGVMAGILPSVITSKHRFLVSVAIAVTIFDLTVGVFSVAYS